MDIDMFHKRLRSKILFVALLFGLAIAHPNIAHSGPSQASQRLQAASADYQRTVSEGTIVGAAVGGVIGGVVGNAIGRNAAGTVLGGVAGSVLGGLIGNGIGTSVAESKAEYARREDRLDQKIAEARNANVKLASLVSAATALVAARQTDYEQLKGTGTIADRRQLAVDLDAEIATIDKALAAAGRARETLRANLANYQGQDARSLSAEARRTDAQMTTLRAKRDELRRLQRGL